MDKVLKQRLVGASILIALAVIFLPMLFNGDDGERTQRQLTLDLPDRPSDSGREVRRLPLDPNAARQPSAETVAETPEQPVPDAGGEAGTLDDSGSAAAEEPEADDAESQVVEAQAMAEPDELAAGDGEAESEQEVVSEGPTAADPEPVDASTDGDWVVQVAVFSNRESAERISERLDGLGHAPMVDVLIRDQAELFRLRAGPYTSEDEAERARNQIAATVAGVEPVVRSFGGDPDGASSRGSGYSVQVGSFASRNNAERLVARVREHGHDAFMHEEESGGRTIWRVRAGLFDDREPAEALLETLRSEAGLDGIVVSHP